MAETVFSSPYTTRRIADTGMWKDFHVMAPPFRKSAIYFNDFTNWVADEWTITEVNNATQTLLDTRNGILAITPAGAEDDGAQLQLGGSGDDETTGESWAPAKGKNLWFECRVNPFTDADQTDIFVGLHVQDTTIIAGRGSDYIGFRIDDGDAYIDCENASGSSAVETLAVATATDNSWWKLGFKVTATDKIEFYVNDALKATHTTKIPTGLMKLSLAMLAGEASANVVHFDYVVVAQDR